MMMRSYVSGSLMDSTSMNITLLCSLKKFSCKLFHCDILDVSKVVWGFLCNVFTE
jgi:hypothetical protein